MDAGLPLDVSAADLYGLRVGAKWTYVRTGDVLRWKEITGCEDVVLIDPDTGARRTVRAYVRENRSAGGLTSVHYLIADETGVRRVRRDDIDDGRGFHAFTVYAPSSPRLLEGPYHAGDLHEFVIENDEFLPEGDVFHGSSIVGLTYKVLGEKDLRVFAGTYRVRGTERTVVAAIPHQITSWFAPGVGEVLEDDNGQIEELVTFTPGVAHCDGTPVEAPACDAPLLECADAWGAGAMACTDPRVDAANCGACGNVCPSGVCAGGACQVDMCAATICDGTRTCCPNPWGGNLEGCTNPARDPSNCGGCGIVCPLGEICDHGTCACADGATDCDGDGVCESLLVDAANCGACGHACGGDTPLCQAGVCASCQSIGRDECGGSCVDLDSDSSNCGTCGTHCGPGYGSLDCAAGECRACSVYGRTDCGGTCADLSFSDDNCGMCGNACAPGEACLNGTCIGGDGSCAPSCPQGKICCGGDCYDPRSSDTYCGGCGVASCAGTCDEACIGGVCGPHDCGGGD